MNEEVHRLDEAQEWIECLAYSPCGAYLAVGSHDDNIYVYETEGYSLAGKLTAANSFITSIDWSADSSYLRSVDGAYELLYFTVPDFEHDPSGASNTKNTEWHQKTAKVAWDVAGCTPPYEDGTHINHINFSPDGSHLISGDDWGLVNVFRAPALEGHCLLYTSPSPRD